MEILCEYVVPDYDPGILVMCGIFMILSFGGSIFCFLDFYTDHEYMMLFYGIVLFILTVLLITGVIFISQSSVTYTLARVPDSVSYQDIVEKWKYISHEGDIYKLIAR